MKVTSIKFSDIPQITRAASYRVNISWGYLEQWLESTGKDVEIDLSPDYQRDHVWTEKQQVRYVEWILRGGTTGREIMFNCPNWSGVGKPGKLELVDGKQRLQAVRRFLANEIPAFGRLFSEYEGKIGMTGPGFVILVNDLQTRAEILQWYVDMNDGGTVHTDDEIAKVRAMIEELKG